jgi:hypothetical protein
MPGPGPSPKIHGTTTTTTVASVAVKSATVSNVEGAPNAVKYTTFGDSEALAAIALCRKMVENGYDLDTKLDIPVLNPFHPIVTIGHFV